MTITSLITRLLDQLVANGNKKIKRMSVECGMKNRCSKCGHTEYLEPTSKVTPDMIPYENVELEFIEDED